MILQVYMRNSQVLVQLDRNDGHTCYHVLKILGMPPVSATNLVLDAF